MHPLRLSIGLLLLLISIAVCAQPQDLPGSPELIVGIAPDKAHVQQQIVQRIRLESPYPFDSLRINLGESEGADVLTLQSPNTRPFENWGVSGFVYETSRALFVNDAGIFSVPPITARGLTTNAAGIQSSFEKTWPGQELSIAPPESSMINASWLVADDVALSEAWSRHPDLLKAGEVATRTVTVVAKGARAEQIDAPVMSLGTGVQVLFGETTRSNVVTDNEVVGTLTQAFEVRIASEQLSDISPVQLSWWDATQQRPGSSAVRGWRIEPILPERATLVESLVEQAYLRQERSRAILLLGVLPVVLLVFLMRFLLKRNPAVGAGARRALRWGAARLLGPSRDLPEIGFSQIRQQRSADRS